MWETRKARIIRWSKNQSIPLHSDFILYDSDYPGDENWALIIPFAPQIYIFPFFAEPKSVVYHIFIEHYQSHDIGYVEPLTDFIFFSSFRKPFPHPFYNGQRRIWDFLNNERIFRETIREILLKYHLEPIFSDWAGSGCHIDCVVYLGRECCHSYHGFFLSFDQLVSENHLREELLALSGPNTIEVAKYSLNRSIDYPDIVLKDFVVGRKTT